MSNALNRAFVKAYHRSQARVPSSPTISTAPPTFESDVTTAANWIGLAEDSYFRMDVGHTASLKSVKIPLATASSAGPLSSRALETIEAAPSRVVPSSSRPMAAASLAVERSLSVDATVATELPVATPRPAAPQPATSKPVIHEDNRSTAFQEHHAGPHFYRLDRPHEPQTLHLPEQLEVEESAPSFRYRPDPEEAAAFVRAKQETLAHSIKLQNEKMFVAGKMEASPAVLPQSAPVSPSHRSFEAVWEVDAFQFNPTIVELFGDVQLLRSIGKPLDDAVSNGLRSLLITSRAKGAGKTSVATGIAVSAAAAGVRVALIDGDQGQSGVADALSLEVPNDWLECLRKQMPLSEAAIRSIEDQFTVFPLMPGSVRSPYVATEFSELIAELRDVFDLLIIDSPWWSADCRAIQRSGAVDAAIVVVDARQVDEEREQQLQDDLLHCGVAGLGLVENFA